MKYFTLLQPTSDTARRSRGGVPGQLANIGVHDGQLHRLCRTGVTGDQPAIIQFRCGRTYAANETNVHEVSPNPVET
jgi:hypothetical protein